MLSLRHVAIFSAASLILAACGKEPAVPARAPEPPVVRDVPVGAVVSTEVDESAEVMGTVKSRTSTTLSSKIVGRIVALHVHEGSLVESGQVLVELEDRDITSQVRRAEAGLREAESALAEVDRAIAAAAAARAAAEAQRDLAASTLARYQQLLDRKAVAPLEYDQVVARQKAALADVERALAEEQAVQAKRQQVLAKIEGAKAEIASIQVTQGYAKITAPFAGVITQKHADVGSMAAPGTPLLTLEDGRRYWLEASVPESQISGIRRGQSLRVQVEEAGLSITAGVSEVLPSADPTTRTTLVRLDLPASPRLRSGLFGRVWVPVGRRQAIQVARGAILERGQLQGVFVVGQDNIARFRLVRTGQTSRDVTEILSGLTGGEQVVLGGTDRVTDGARIERK
ncbi:MAG TPA: efflux RND transporter periplasmic adaptor subunit [Candidatus Methylomirabilis sp.]|nr:efflux RND transporter periplasmic adaptor subunit [Candidatus Methylomirabilis sp.]